MGRYYSEQKVLAGNFTKVYPQMRGEQPRTRGRLVGIFDRLMWNVCVDITDPGEWQEFFNQYAQGLFVDMKLFDVPADADIEK